MIYDEIIKLVKYVKPLWHVVNLIYMHDWLAVSNNQPANYRMSKDYTTQSSYLNFSYIEMSDDVCIRNVTHEYRSGLLPSIGYVSLNNLRFEPPLPPAAGNMEYYDSGDYEDLWDLQVGYQDDDNSYEVWNDDPA